MKITKTDTNVVKINFKYDKDFKTVRGAFDERTLMVLYKLFNGYFFLV